MRRMDFSIFIIASWVGSVAFALSGFLAGARKHLDVMGIFILAILTANGGGALRDVLIGKTPSVLTDMSAFLLVLTVVTIALVTKLHRNARLEKHQIFLLSDAVGLAAFSVTGALAGIGADLSLFGVMVLAFLTATGGGIIRDVMVNDVPSVLSSDFYGSIAILMGAAIYALHATDLLSDVTISLVLALALGLRVLAYKRGWRLPRITT